MKKFVVVCYKPESTEHCRGQIVERYSSDVKMDSLDTEEDCIEFISQLNGSILGHFEADYEVSIRVFDFERPNQTEDDRDFQDMLADKIERMACEKTLQVRKRNLEIKKEKELLESLERERAQVEREKREFERLRLKFGEEKMNVK